MKNLLMPSWKVFKTKVTKFKEIEAREMFYRIARSYLDKSEKKDAIKIILLGWNQRAFLGKRVSERELDESISNFLENEDNQDKIEKLSRENIETINFDDRYGNTTLRELIKSLYRGIRKENFIGSTGASKFLHLLNIDLFMMWDNGICKTYNHSGGSSGGYLEFMIKMQKLAEHLFDEIKKLGESDLKEYMIRELVRKGYKPTIPKLLDEYNYVISKKIGVKALPPSR